MAPRRSQESLDELGSEKQEEMLLLVSGPFLHIFMNQFMKTKLIFTEEWNSQFKFLVCLYKCQERLRVHGSGRDPVGKIQMNSWVLFPPSESLFDHHC